MSFGVIYSPVINEPFDSVIVFVQARHHNVFGRNDEIQILLDQRLQVVVVDFVFCISESRVRVSNVLIVDALVIAVGYTHPLSDRLFVQISS